MRGRIERWRDTLRGSLWVIPGLCVLLAIGLALVMVEVDHTLSTEFQYSFGAGADGAREVLSAITTAMITFTALVFTITIVVLQLTSSQFSPRVLRTFLRDRQTQWSLGTFTATFVYSVMVLRSVRSDGQGISVFVPGLSTTLALALLLLSVALFISYIHHIATAIQVSSIIAAIGDETRQTLDRRNPPGRSDPVDDAPAAGAGELPSAQVPARASGVVLTVDEERLVQLACDADVVLRTRLPLGAFVPEGAPLFEVVGDPDRLDLGAVCDAVGQGRERSLQQDVAFGLRQLVDVAERALSPGINDPTTAVQVLDQLHDLLRRMATRPLRTGVHRDGDGQVRLVMPAERFEDYLTLAIDGIDHHGADQRPVQERIDALLDDLAVAALPQYRRSVQEVQARRAASTRGFERAAG